MSRKKKNRQLILHHRKGYKEFPSFTYPQKDREIGHVSKDFISIVKEGVRSINFNDEILFTDEDREAYRHAKQIGIDAFIMEMRRSMSLEDFSWKLRRFYDMIGFYTYEFIRERNLFDYYFPYNNVSFFPPSGSNFAVYFDTLLSIQPPGCGRIYYSRTPPLIMIDGVKYKLAFTRHAIERMGDRISHDRKCFYGINYFMNYFTESGNYELVERAEWKAVSFFGWLTPGGYRDKNLGEFNIFEGNGEYLYREGYCPIELVDGFAVAKTWLMPGMNGTPEDELIRNTILPPQEKDMLMKSKENIMSFSSLYKTKDFKAVKWFHENGVPQVIKAGEIIIPTSTTEPIVPGSSSPLDCSSSSYIPSAPCRGHAQTPCP